MEIREATQKDFPKLNKLFKQIDGIHSEKHPELFKKPIDNVRSNEFISNLINNDKARLIVTTVKDEVVGLAIGYIESSPDFPLFVKREWLLISIIAVDNDYKRQGIGKKLLDKLYDWAKANNITDVELTVFAFNESAIKFYKKNGFTNIKHKMYRQIDKS